MMFRGLTLFLSMSKRATYCTKAMLFAGDVVECERPRGLTDSLARIGLGRRDEPSILRANRGWLKIWCGESNTRTHTHTQPQKYLHVVDVCVTLLDFAVPLPEIKFLNHTKETPD